MAAITLGSVIAASTRSGAPQRGHDEAAMACVGGEQTMKSHEMGSRTRHQRGQASDEVQRLEQAALGILPPAAFVHPCTAHMGGAVAKGVLQRVDHQGVAVAAQALQRNGRARHIAAQALSNLRRSPALQATAALSEKPSRLPPMSRWPSSSPALATLTTQVLFW